MSLDAPVQEILNEMKKVMIVARSVRTELTADPMINVNRAITLMKAVDKIHDALEAILIHHESLVVSQREQIAESVARLDKIETTMMEHLS